MNEKEANELVDGILNVARSKEYTPMFPKVKWTTDRPTEPGWYYVYDEYEDERPPITILEVTRPHPGTSYDSLVVHEGTNGETDVSDYDLATHWSKITLPDPPK